MFHDCSKNESRHERDGKRISHRIVVLVEGIFKDVQAQALVEVLEENLAHIIAFADDDGIFRTQLVEIGKGRTEHRVSRYVAEPACFVPFLQAGLHRSDIADDAILRKGGQHLVERIEGVLHGSCIDDQLRTELLYFFELGETIAVVHEAQLLWVHIKYSGLVLETQYVGKEGAHLSGSKD